jgi:hypothetical protein
MKLIDIITKDKDLIKEGIFGDIIECFHEGSKDPKVVNVKCDCGRHFLIFYKKIDNRMKTTQVCVDSDEMSEKLWELYKEKVLISFNKLIKS